MLSTATRLGCNMSKSVLDESVLLGNAHEPPLGIVVRVTVDEEKMFNSLQKAIIADSKLRVTRLGALYQRALAEKYQYTIGL